MLIKLIGFTPKLNKITSSTNFNLSGIVVVLNPSIAHFHVKFLQDGDLTILIKL